MPVASPARPSEPVLLSVREPGTERSRLHRYGLAMATGVLFGLAFPPLPLTFLGWIALVPLLIVMDWLKPELPGGYRRVFRHAWWGFFPFTLVANYWIGFSTVPGLVALMFIHPLFFAAPPTLSVFVRRRLGRLWGAVALVLGWVVMEWFHASTEFAYPWMTLGHSQATDLPLIQFAEFTGAFGLTLWMLGLNVLAYALWIGRRDRSLLVAGAVWLLAPFGYGIAVLSAAPPEGTVGPNAVRLGLVQGNIDPWEKWDALDRGQQLELHLSLSRDLVRQAGRDSLDAIIWPETAVPFYLMHPQFRDLYRRLEAGIDSLNVPLVTGIPDLVDLADSTVIPFDAKTYPGTDHHYLAYNAVAVIPPGLADRPPARYRKVKLVPAGEKLPYADYLPEGSGFVFLKEGISDWNIGRSQAPFALPGRPGVRFATPICFESNFPGFVAQSVREGAQFLVVVTNDGWFGHTSGPYQHKDVASIRAVETRRDVARAANTGITCVIDRYGRIRQETEWWTRATRIVTVEPRTDLTMYTRWGDWIVGLCALGLVGLVGWSFRRA